MKKHTKKEQSQIMFFVIICKRKKKHWKEVHFIGVGNDQVN